jgi:hypothetical protein
MVARAVSTAIAIRKPRDIENQNLTGSPFNCPIAERFMLNIEYIIEAAAEVIATSIIS